MIAPEAIALNQFLLNLILHEIQQGHLARCQAMGLSAPLIATLQRLTPQAMSRLVYAPIKWNEVRINPKALEAAVGEVYTDEDDALITEAIRLGATSEMLIDEFGLPYNETSLRRKILNAEKRPGRPRELTYEETDALWRQWKKIGGEEALGRDRIKKAMEIAKESRIPLSQIWAEITTQKAKEKRL